MGVCRSVVSALMNCCNIRMLSFLSGSTLSIDLASLIEVDTPAQHACCPPQSHGLDVAVVQQCQSRNGFAMVPLRQTCCAQHQASRLRISTALQGQQIHRKFFRFVPSTQSNMEHHFRLG